MVEERTRTKTRICVDCGTPFEWPVHVGQPAKRCPDGCTDPVRVFRRAVQAEWDLDVRHLAILDQACAVLKEIYSTSATLHREGLFYHDRFGQPKVHPLQKELRQLRVVFARLVRELGLDVDEEDFVLTPTTVRPPRVR